MSLDIDTDPARVPKHPAEVLDIRFDFTALLGEDVSLTAAIVRVSDSANNDVTSEMLAQTPAVDMETAEVQARLRLGEDGQSYACACMGVLSTGERKVLRTYIDVGQGEFGPNLNTVCIIRQVLGSTVQSIAAEVP